MLDSQEAILTINQWMVPADTLLPNGNIIKKNTSKITIGIENWPQDANNATNNLVLNFGIEAQSLDGNVGTSESINGLELIVKGLGGI